MQISDFKKLDSQMEKLMLGNVKFCRIGHMSGVEDYFFVCDRDGNNLGREFEFSTLAEAENKAKSLGYSVALPDPRLDMFSMV